MKLTINRNFAHRAYGDIGKVELAATVTGATLDGEVLPDESVEYLLRFALQSLQDAYAGAKTQAEAQGAWGKKRDALIAGTIGTRGDGDGASMETVVGRSVMRNAFKLKVGAKSEAFATFTGLSDADQLAKLDAWLAGPQGIALADAIAKETTLRKERAANKIDAAKGVDFDL